MQTQTLDVNGKIIVECLPGKGQVTGEQDALDLLAACGEAGTQCLLLSAGCLSDDFYNLRSGLAGAVLLKFTMYRIVAAAVIPPAISTQGKFGEFVLETNRRRDFRVYAAREDALAWLQTVA